MAKLFFAGIPTENEVNQLMDTFGVPTMGTVITYSQIEGVVGVEQGTSRFRTIASAWRRRLYREFNLILKAVTGEGFKVLDNSGRVDFSTSVYKHGIRRVVRASDIAAKTDRSSLSPEEKRVCDHIQNNGASIRLAAATAARELKFVTA